MLCVLIKNNASVFKYLELSVLVFDIVIIYTVPILCSRQVAISLHIHPFAYYYMYIKYRIVCLCVVCGWCVRACICMCLHVDLHCTIPM